MNNSEQQNPASEMERVDRQWSRELDSGGRMIREACQHHVTCTKWLLVPSLRIASQWKEWVNRSGQPTLNLHGRTLPSIVMEWSAADPEFKDYRYAEFFTIQQWLERLLKDAFDGGRFRYFGNVRSTTTFSEMIAGTLADLRLADVQPESIRECDFESPAKATDIRWLLQSYVDWLRTSRLWDYAQRVKSAMGRVDVVCPGQWVLIQPEAISCGLLEHQFLQSLKAKATSVYQTEFWAGDVLPGPAVATMLQGERLKVVRAAGEVNEVRRAMAQVLMSDRSQSSDLSNPTLGSSDTGCGLDHWEWLHSDSQTYVPLIYELMTEWCEEQGWDEVPVTFAEGIPTVYSRPGRSLRAWVRWCRHDWPQSDLVQLVREGLLNVPQSESGAVYGFSRLADQLRELPIGQGRDRYLQVINDQWQRLEVAINSLPSDESDQEQQHQRHAALQLQREQLEVLGKTVLPLLENSPAKDSDSREVLSAAIQFLQTHARSVSQLDRYSLERLANELQTRKATLDSEAMVGGTVWDWLEGLAVRINVMGSGPRPGCVHVAPLLRGGYSGRRLTWVFGMDDRRFPKRIAQDPLLLDAERQRVEKRLPTTSSRWHDQTNQWRQVRHRLTGKIWYSYGTESLREDGVLFPSSSLLEVMQAEGGRPAMTLDDLAEMAGLPSAYVASNVPLVSIGQWWVQQMVSSPSAETRNRWLHQTYPNLERGWHAESKRAAPEFSPQDGWVPLAADLAPGAEGLTSPSRLETYGTCPRKFLFRYGLQLKPPQEYRLDPERWLDPMQVGTLLHSVFEKFLKRVIEQADDAEPFLEWDRDSPLLFSLLDQEIESYRDAIPVPNQEAYQRQCQQLQRTCRNFLRKDLQYCEQTGARPWVLEAAIGLKVPPESVLDDPEPVSIPVGSRRIQVAGRLDRVDRIGEGSWTIWDYKTGSTYGFHDHDPFQGGRKLQSWLYVKMLEQRLESIGEHATGHVDFGYFFPGPRAGGRRVKWNSDQLAAGEAIVQQIIRAIQEGIFLATLESTDCRFCDFLPICGDPKQTAFASSRKLESGAQSLQTLVTLKQLGGNHE